MRCSVDTISLERRPGRPEAFIWRVHFYDELDLPMLGLGATMFSQELASLPQHAARIGTLREHFVDLARAVFLDWDEYLADGQGFDIHRVDVVHYSVGERPGYGISVEALRDGDLFPGNLLLTHYSLAGAVTVNHKLIIEDPAVADWVDTQCRAILVEAEAIGLVLNAGRSMERKRATKLSRYMEPERRLRKGS